MTKRMAEVVLISTTPVGSTCLLSVSSSTASYKIDKCREGNPLNQRKSIYHRKAQVHIVSQLQIRKTTFISLSCSIAASLALHADQYEAHRMVPTAISHRNTSAMSTKGRVGEYSCTDTANNPNVKHTIWISSKLWFKDKRELEVWLVADREFEVWGGDFY